MSRQQSIPANILQQFSPTICRQQTILANHFPGPSPRLIHAQVKVQQSRKHRGVFCSYNLPSCNLRSAPRFHSKILPTASVIMYQDHANDSLVT